MMSKKFSKRSNVFITRIIEKGHGKRKQDVYIARVKKNKVIRILQREMSPDTWMYLKGCVSYFTGQISFRRKQCALNQTAVFLASKCIVMRKLNWDLLIICMFVEDLSKDLCNVHDLMHVQLVLYQPFTNLLET